MASRARVDPLAGTAPPIERYLLVEHPGPWGASAHPTQDLPRPQGDALRAAAARLGARLLLIRRPGRQSRPDQLRWGYADARLATLRWGTCSDLTSASFDPEEATPGEAAYLVCTQGRHDRCCAIDGRPVAAALARLRPEQTWECTHVGGDRFAANVVVLPHGLAYGRVGPDDAAELVAAYEAGRLVPRLLRGRTTGPPALQYVAAQIRRLTGSAGVDDVEPLEVARSGPDAWRVVLRVRGQAYESHVRETHSVVATPLTCAGVGPGTQRGFETLALDRVPEPRAGR
ncbi:MAG TPA: sucrase ferredoxin [Actinomycetes bacterium]|nr:sucrase ferredoxin [Actinomycetes bacterium]